MYQFAAAFCVELCFDIAEKASRKEVDEVGRHDKRSADILLAENTGRLQLLREQLCELPLESYDAPLNFRIKAFNRVAGASLRTPEREQLLAGTAPRVTRTQMRARALVLEEPEAPAAAPKAAPAAAAADATPAAVDIDDDEFADDNEVDKELAKEAADNSATGDSAAGNVVYAKPLRRTSHKKPTEKPVVAGKGKGKGKAADQGAEVLLSPRTGEPNTRPGGPYNMQEGAKRVRAAQVIDLAGKMTAAASAPAQRLASANDQKVEKLKTTIGELHAGVVDLKTANAALYGQLELVRKGSELRVEAVMAKDGQCAHGADAEAVNPGPSDWLRHGQFCCNALCTTVLERAAKRANEWQQRRRQRLVPATVSCSDRQGVR
eukprot:6177989-Pleurochrysis_carterae.AAC.3